MDNKEETLEEGNEADYSEVMSEMNKDITSEEMHFFGHLVNSDECVWFLLNLRGPVRGPPPKIAEKRCNGFPSEDEIRHAIASFDGIERKLQTRKAICTNGVWLADFNFSYRKSDSDKEVYNLLLNVEVTLDGHSNTSEAISFIKEAREIAKEQELIYKKQLDEQKIFYDREIANQKQFYDGQIKYEREQNTAALKAERDLLIQKLDIYDKFVTNMQKTLTSAVEAKVGISSSDAQLRDMQSRLIGSYEETLKRVSTNGSDETTEGFIKQLENSITVVSTLIGTAQKVKGFLGSADIPNAPLPGDTVSINSTPVSK